MGPSPILSIIHIITIGTMLNLNGLFRLQWDWDRDWEGWVTVYYVKPPHCNLCGTGTCTYTLALYQSQSRSHISSVRISHHCGNNGHGLKSVTCKTDLKSVTE